MNYWLFKSEPETFSFDDLKKSKNQITYWDGIRNYQARNYIRAEMKLGDRVLFYHSSTDIPAVVGLCKIVREAYPDFTAYDTKNIHYDSKSKKDNPTWYMVDIKFEKDFLKPVTLSIIKMDQKLKSMKLVQKGNRLSVIPVTKEEFDEIVKLGTGK